MNFLAVTPEESVIRDLLDESMLENVFLMRLKRLCPDQVETFKAVQTLVDAAPKFCDAFENLVTRFAYVMLTIQKKWLNVKPNPSFHVIGLNSIQ